MKRCAVVLTLAVVALLGATPAYALGNPDSTRTPGATDPRVTQANIQQTICVDGYTATVRKVSTTTKSRVYAAYHIGKSKRRGYVIDHLVPLELGGSNSRTNLWPQPKKEATRKDVQENSAHRRVCSGAVALSTTQLAFETDWATAGSATAPTTTAPPTTTTPPTTVPPTTAPPPPPPTTQPPTPQQTEPPPPPQTEPPPPPQTEPPPPPSNCNPNYTPCVPNDPVDVDCAGGGGNGPSYVTGPVTVIGTDVYGLDSDHNGIGCE